MVHSVHRCTLNRGGNVCIPVSSDVFVLSHRKLWHCIVGFCVHMPITLPRHVVLISETLADAVRARVCGLSVSTSASSVSCSSLWCVHGACRSNSGYMLDQCQHSCKLCTRYYESEPPMFTTLWNGLLLRTVGFGTAGLGADTEEAVLQALEAGYTHIDSAQGRQWYREDSTAKVLHNLNYNSLRVL